MKCGLARSSGNIYACRGATKAGIFFAVLLLIVSLLYFFWMRTLLQRPWRYINIHEATELIAQGVDHPELRLQETSVDACPMCHVAQHHRFGPGVVCFWCEVARRSFVPFAVGVSAGTLTLVLEFSVSLRPSFGDWYYALLLIAPWTLYALFAAYIMHYQAPVPNDELNRETTFGALAMALCGRHISAMFHVEANTRQPTLIVVDRAGLDDGAGQHRVVSLAMEREMVPEFRRKLEDELKAGEDVVWWENPFKTGVRIDYRWLFHFFGALLLLGLCAFVVGGLAAGEYPRALPPPAMMRFIAVVVIICCIVILVNAWKATTRMHVLTNKRLITITSGVMGGEHVSATSLIAIDAAQVEGFAVLGWSIVTFCWQTKDGSGKRHLMPQLQHKNRFVGIKQLGTFLEHLATVAPKLKTMEDKEKSAHQRSAWRIYISMQIVIVEAVPLLFMASGLSAALAFFGVLFAWNMSIAIVARGLRVLATTTVRVQGGTSGIQHWGLFGEAGFSMERLTTLARGKRDRAPSFHGRPRAPSQEPAAAAAAATAASVDFEMPPARQEL
jgi:hypothetical protein